MTRLTDASRTRDTCTTEQELFGRTHGYPVSESDVLFVRNESVVAGHPEAPTPKSPTDPLRLPCDMCLPLFRRPQNQMEEEKLLVAASWDASACLSHTEHLLTGPAPASCRARSHPHHPPVRRQLYQPFKCNGKIKQNQE